MAEKKVQDIIRKIKSLPALPFAVKKLCRLAEDQEADIQTIGKVILDDEALTARILRVANSAFYGLSRRISSVSEAVVILGFQAVKNLALGVTVFGYMGEGDDASPLNRMAFWRHSLGVASGARQLAKWYDLQDSDETFTAGLLHDIGKIVLLEHLPEQYAQVLDKTASGSDSLSVLEKEAFGMNHSEVGRELCQYWKIPEVLSQAVADHHRLFKAGRMVGKKDRLAYVTQIADNVAKIAQIGASGNPNIETHFLQGLGGNEILSEQLRQVILVLPSEVSKTEVFLDLPSGPEAEKETQPRKSSSVFVLVQDAAHRELITMTLLSQGYTLASQEQIEGREGSVAGLVTDGPVPASLRDICSTRGIPMLDLAQWQKARGCSESAPINIHGLKAWLTKGLPAPLDKEPL